MEEAEEEEYSLPQNSVITSGVYIEPPPFRSVQEADEFLRNHEIATNNKFITEMTRTFTTAGVPTMKYPKIRWTYPYADCEYFDGIPFAIIGIRKYSCQYGNGYNESRRMANKRLTAKRRLQKGIVSNKTRSVAPSKKVNCPAKAKMTLIVKFPDYAIPEDKRSKRYMMGCKMKREFSDDTQRYVMVYLRIFHHHSHGALALQLNNVPSKITAAHVESTSTIILKQGATLRGRSLTGLIPQFTCCTEIPDCLAQPSPTQRLEDMQIEELLALYWDLTGDAPNNVFDSIQRECTEDSLRLLLHLCIVFANAESETDGRIVAHRSVRIAGTEKNFEPILCCKSDCILDDAHMHCPLCPPTRAYTSPEVLKLHFEKKHIKIALDYGGLKILRCRDECAVKGVIKDLKAFTRGHWHCWKCDMGYEKREERCFNHFQSHLLASQAGSVLITESVFPCMNPYTVSFNIDPSLIRDFSTGKKHKTQRRVYSASATFPGLNYSALPTTPRPNYSAMPTTPRPNYSAAPTTPRHKYSALPITDTPTYSDNEDHEDDQELFVPISSDSPSTAHVGSELMYTSATGEDISQGYEQQTILYIQEGENGEEVVYTQALTEPSNEHILYTQAGENTDEVIIEIPEHVEQDESVYLPFLQLREKVTELQQKCIQLERNNTAQKSEISFLNKKIETLHSKQYTCSKCSVAIPPDLTKPSKQDKTQSLVQSLNDLHSKYQRTTKCKPEADDITIDLTEGLLELKKEIETLKRVTGIGKQIPPPDGVPFNGQTSGEGVNDAIQPFYLGADTSTLEQSQFEMNLIAGVDGGDNADVGEDSESDTGSISELDYKAFGRSGIVKRGKRGKNRIVVLPLPEEAAEMVERCNNLISEERNKQTVYIPNSKPAVTQICRVWKAERNDKEVQTDIDEEFQIYYDNDSMPSIVLTGPPGTAGLDGLSDYSLKSTNLNQSTESVNLEQSDSWLTRTFSVEPMSGSDVTNSVAGIPSNQVSSPKNSAVSNPSVQKLQNSQSKGSVFVKAAKIVPSNKQTAHTGESITGNSVKTSKNDGPSPVKMTGNSPSPVQSDNGGSSKVKSVALKPVVVEKLNTTETISAKDNVSDSNDAKQSTSETTVPVKTVSFKLSVKAKTTGSAGEPIDVEESSGDKTAKSCSTGPVKTISSKTSTKKSESGSTVRLKLDTTKSDHVTSSVEEGPNNDEKSATSEPSDTYPLSVMRTRGISKKRPIMFQINTPNAGSAGKPTVIESSGDKTLKSSDTSPVKAVSSKTSKEISESDTTVSLKPDSTRPVKPDQVKFLVDKGPSNDEKSATFESSDQSSLSVMRTRGISKKRPIMFPTKTTDTSPTGAKKKKQT